MKLSRVLTTNKVMAWEWASLLFLGWLLHNHSLLHRRVLVQAHYITEIPNTWHHFKAEVSSLSNESNSQTSVSIMHKIHRQQLNNCHCWFANKKILEWSLHELAGLNETELVPPEIKGRLSLDMTSDPLLMQPYPESRNMEGTFAGNINQ